MLDLSGPIFRVLVVLSLTGVQACGTDVPSRADPDLDGAIAAHGGHSDSMVGIPNESGGQPGSMDGAFADMSDSGAHGGVMGNGGALEMGGTLGVGGGGGSGGPMGGGGGSGGPMGGGADAGAAGAGGGGSTPPVLTIDPDTMAFFELPIGSIRYAVAGQALDSETCVVLVWTYEGVPRGPTCTGPMMENWPYVVVTPNSGAPCDQWDFGGNVTVDQANGCVHFSGGGVDPSEVDVTLQVSAGPFSGTIIARRLPL